MPEPLNRATFLLRVADAVDLQPAEVGEVLEELNSHLSDAAAGWREAGVAPDDAELRAIRSLGDPERLGRELGRARHRARYLLAAVGGGIWSAVTFGVFAYLVVWLALGGLALAVSAGVIWLLQTLGVDTGTWLAGSAGSLVTVSFTALWFAWVGWVLPQRVARAARRSVDGVRVAVGVAGFGLGTALLWTQVQVAMDPVLAFGLPLAPVAFLLAAWRPARGPDIFPVTTVRSRLVVALAVAAAVTVVGVAVRTPPADAHGGSVNVAAIGSSDLVGVGTPGSEPSVTFTTTAGTLTASWSYPAAVVARYPFVSLEIWPAVQVAGGDLAAYVAGAAPLAAVRAPTSDQELASSISIAWPMPRTPEPIISVLVAEGRDGSRVVIGPPDFGMTPAWHGSLVDWWLSGR